MMFNGGDVSSAAKASNARQRRLSGGVREAASARAGLGACQPGLVGEDD
jgi:hypothetical protein